MTHLYRILATCFLCLTTVAAPLRWHWSNPLPHGNNIAAMAVDPTWGYIQVADHGQFYTSPDLVAWTPSETGTLKALRSAAFFGSRLVVTGESGLVMWADQVDNFNLLDLGTADWLESVAVSPTKLVAVGDSAAIYTSTTGTNWTRQSVSFTDWLRAVTWASTSGGLFVAVGETGRIATSADGVRWITRNSGVTVNLNSVAWTGTHFIAVGDAGKVLFSNAGGTIWTTQSGVGATGDLNTVAIETPNVRLAAGENEVRLNITAGLASLWTDQLATTKAAPAPKATYLTSLWDGTNFIFGGRAGLTVTGRRPSGSLEYSWNLLASPSRSLLFDIAPAVSTGTNVSASFLNGALKFSTNQTTNTFYAAVGDTATILTSDNGVSWSSALVPSSASNSIYLGVAGNRQGLVAVGSLGTISFSPIAYSPVVTTNSFTNGANITTVVLTNQANTLGLAWYASPSPTNLDLQAVCATENLYIVGGDQGFLATSPNGTNWTRRTSGTTHYLSGLEAWPGGYVAVGEAGTILTSPDATNWVSRSVATTNWIYRVRWLGGQLVAAGQNGAIYTSPTGTNWTARTSGTTAWIDDLEYIAGNYYAVATQGVLLTSTNAINWVTDTSIITGKSLYGAATIDGQLIIVGAEGVILRAQAGPFPGPVQLVTWPHQPSDKLYIFNGSPDQVFRLDRSTDLKTWMPGFNLEITDPAGSLLLLDDTTNNPARQFYGTTEIP